MENGLISVIIPTLNEEQYIRLTLVSLKKQEYDGPVEIIVADGMSADRTVVIAKKYADKVITVKKKGVSAGRNEGAKIAEGDLLVFFDGDTLAAKNLLATIAEYFQNEALLAGTPRILTTETRKLGRYQIANEFGIKLLYRLKKPIMPAVCLACRKEVFWQAGGFNEALQCGEDIQLSTKIRKMKGKVIYLEDTAVYTSPRRLERWGVMRQLMAWPFGYLHTMLRNKQPSYDPIR